MATILLGIGMGLMFINPFAAVVFFIVGGILATIEDRKTKKETDKKKKIDDAGRTYHTLKNTEPLSPKTIQAYNESIDDPRRLSHRLDHNDFLRNRLAKFEEKFHNGGFTSSFWGAVTLANNSNDELNTLFANPDKYKTICKGLGREPINELIMEWQKQIDEQKTRTRLTEEKKIAFDQAAPEILRMIRKNVSRLENSNCDYRDIVNFIIEEFKMVRRYNLEIKRENSRWFVSIGNHNDAFQIESTNDPFPEARIFYDSDQRRGLFFCHTSEQVKALLVCGLNVNETDRLGNTQLHINENLSAIECMLDFGADVNARNSIGSTPLKRAILFKDERKISLLLARGAIDQRN